MKAAAAAASALAILLADCGESSRHEGRCVKLPLATNWTFEAWRSPGGTLYLRTRRLVPPVRLAGCDRGPDAICRTPSFKGLFSIARNHRWIDVDYRHATFTYGSAHQLWQRLFADGRAPEVAVVEAALVHADRTPKPAWAKYVDRVL